MGLGLLLNIVVAKKLTEDGYGEYSFAMAALSLVAVFTGAGFARLAQRQVAQLAAKDEPQANREFQGTSLRLVVLYSFGTSIAIGAMVGVALWLNWISVNAATMFGLAALGFPIWSVLELVSGIAYGRGNIFLGLLPRAIVQPIAFMAMAYCLSSPASSVSIFLVFILSSLFALFSAILFTRDFLDFCFRYDRAKAWEWQASALHFSFSGLFTIGLLQGDILLMGVIAPTTETGGYGLAAKIASITLVPLALVTTAFSHELAGAFAKRDAELVNRSLFKIGASAAIFGLPATVFTFLFPDFVISIFNSTFQGTKSCLMILLMAQTVHILGSIGVTHLNMTGYERQGKLVMGYGLCTNILLGITLIPFFGGMGAAFALLSATLVWTVSGVYYSKKLTGFWTPFFMVSLNSKSMPPSLNIDLPVVCDSRAGLHVEIMPAEMGTSEMSEVLQ
jgi:O-antigen/teichoic acid export membrane protein